MAISTIKVGGTIGKTFRVEISADHPFVIDQPKAGGGNDEGPNPLETFLATLAACFCTMGRIIANQRKIELRKIECETEGDIDKDFLMGKTDVGRSGFTEIRSFVKIDADMTEEEKKAFLHEIERRCPMADNISKSTPLTSSIVG
ncbi:MAG: OsmC family protein [Bacteroidales bacterium]|jgi:uncharacterized OsmC-like protein|nr:OsmC family protein [Mariniphaga sp.]NLB93445.1 OsmC family protein [Bacteroidales bacterium]